MHHELAEALQGDVVLLARPRNIQRKDSKLRHAPAEIDLTASDIPEGEDNKWSADPHPLWKEKGYQGPADFVHAIQATMSDMGSTAEKKDKMSKFRTIRSIPASELRSNNTVNYANNKHVSRTHSAGMVASHTKGGLGRSSTTSHLHGGARPKSSGPTGASSGNGTIGITSYVY